MTRTRCPDCDFAMPLPPHASMTWCPCGWREDLCDVLLQAAQAAKTAEKEEIDEFVRPAAL